MRNSLQSVFSQKSRRLSDMAAVCKDMSLEAEERSMLVDVTKQCSEDCEWEH
jgi:hypothetical protein